MNKLFTKIAAVFLGVTMAVGVGVAVGTSAKASQVDAATTEVLVSSASSTYYENGYLTGNLGTNKATWTGTGFTAEQLKNSGNAVSLSYAEIRIYGSHSFIITPNSGNAITSVVLLADSNSYANAVGGSSLTNCTKSVSSSTVTLTPEDGSSAVGFTNSAQSRIRTISVSFDSSSTGHSYSITYHKNGAVEDAPAAQSGTGTSVKLSNTVLTKPGFAHDGWSTSDSSATAEYALGQVVTLEQDWTTTLYAHWVVDSNTYVTFDATSDTGTSPLNKNGVQFACNNGVLNNGSEYRLYKNSVTTFSVSNATIKKITFTCTSDNPASGFTTQTGWTVTSPNGEWIGSSASVSFTAGNSQVRATKIVIAYLPDPVVQATTMTISPASATVDAGTPVTFTPTLSGGSGNYEKTIGWETDDATIVEVPEDSEDGVAVTVSTLKSGTVTLTGTVVSPGYATKSIVIIVKEAKVLESIAVTTPPNDTDYNEGESFDPTGMVVTATYEDKTTSEVTSFCTYSPDGALSADDDKITISYTLGNVTKTTTQAISVTERDKYQKITSLDGLAAGAKYVIGNANGTKFMSTTQNTNNRAAYTLSGVVSDNVVFFEEGMEVIELGGSTGSWTLEATAGEGDALGYLYAASSSNNYLRTQSDATTWAITLSNSEFSLVSNSGYSHNELRINGDIFSCYASGQQPVTLWKYLTTTESATISKGSLKGLIGDTNVNDPVSITCLNFTPTSIDVEYSVDDVATVTNGTIENGIIPLNVSYDGIGDTVATIEIIGGKKSHSVELSISVADKPKSITVSGNGIVGNTLEMENTTSKTFSKNHVSVINTRDQEYVISSIADIKITSSDETVVSINSGTLTAESTGTANVTFAVKALESVCTTIIVTVNNDYPTEVAKDGVQYAENLEAEQGESPTLAIFTSRVAKTHFKHTIDLDLSYFRFSYTNEMGAVAASFIYDFAHGEIVDAKHKLQTIYVYCTLGNVSVGSYQITIEQKNDPLTAITLTNPEIENDEVDITRGDHLQLTWALTPEYPTDTNEVAFSVNDSDEGVIVTVNDSGYISVSANSGLGTATIKAEGKYKASVYTYLYVNVTLESMSYVVDAPDSWVKVTDVSSLKAGNTIIITSENKGKVLGSFTGSNKYANEGTATFDKGVASDISGALEFTLENGSTSGTWKLKNGSKYLYGTSAKTTLCLSDASTDFTITITSDGATINTGGSCRILHNAGSTRFSNYTSDVTSSMLLPQIYKNNGGEQTKDVDSVLFNGVHNNFGESNATYTWDESCESFDSTKWNAAGAALTGITDFDDYMLNRAIADINGNEIEVFLAKYDYIMNKPGLNATDFLHRFDEGGIHDGERAITNPINNIFVDSTNTIAIIAIISVVSVSAIGGYFFLRKRREEN